MSLLTEHTQSVWDPDKDPCESLKLEQVIEKTWSKEELEQLEIGGCVTLTVELLLNKRYDFYKENEKLSVYNYKGSFNFVGSKRSHIWNKTVTYQVELEKKT